MSGLKGRVALVTGGSRGIGRAISLALAEAGAMVATNYRERVDDANALVDEIRIHNGRAEAFSCDVSIGTSVGAMVRAIEERLGPIDILVNNAGIAASHGDQTTEEDFDRTIAINLKSAFLCTEAVLSGMRERRWGRIVHLSAMGARVGSRSVAYGAAKAGLEGLTRSYALQLAKQGVTVNAVAPSLIDTEMTRTRLCCITRGGQPWDGYDGWMFKRRRFPVEIILICVRWYCKYGISYRDLTEMMQERGVEVDPTTIMRWVHRYAPELEKRVRSYQGYAQLPGEWTRPTSRWAASGSTCSV